MQQLSYNVCGYGIPTLLSRDQSDQVQQRLIETTETETELTMQCNWTAEDHAETPEYHRDHRHGWRF